MSADGKILGEWDASALRSLLESDALESITVTLVPVILGGGKSATLSGLPGDFLPEDRHFELKEMKEVEGGVLLHYRRNRKR
jgi:riboflavin biosynthesis pyrimidine reductase